MLIITTSLVVTRRSLETLWYGVVSLLERSPWSNTSIISSFSKAEASGTLLVQCNGKHFVGAFKAGKFGMLWIKNNQLIGSIVNCSKLRVLSLASNNPSGIVSEKLGELANLTELHLYSDGLTGPIPVSIAYCSKLSGCLLPPTNALGVYCLQYTCESRQLRGLYVLDLDFFIHFQPL